MTQHAKYSTSQVARATEEDGNPFEHSANLDYRQSQDSGLCGSDVFPPPDFARPSSDKKLMSVGNYRPRSMLGSTDQFEQRP